MREIKGIKLTRELREHVEKHIGENINGKNIGTKEISEAEGYYISTYRELVEQVANLSYINKDYLLFFRGQTQDYKKVNSRKSTFYPTIYRGYLPEEELKYSFDKLNIASEKLVKLFKENEIDGINELKRKKYIQWSILQHYEVTDTPLIDITQSLKVACSFAQLDEKSREVFVYVFGLPYYINRISHNSEQDLVNIRLLSISPPKALRPYFQEGFLIGTEDITYKYEKKEELDLNNRLIAKFKIPNDSSFWGESFNKIPKDALYPSNDDMEKICNKIKNDINVKILAISLSSEREGYSAQDIISIHQKKIDKDRFVYFSTSVQIDKSRAKEQNYLLLYNKKILCLCKIESYIEKSDDKKYTPEDSDRYSPKEFLGKKEKHWFLISEIDNLNINDNDKEKLKHFRFVNKRVDKNVYEYIEESGRLQPFYLEGWID